MKPLGQYPMIKDYTSNINTTIDFNTSNRVFDYWYKFYTYNWRTNVKVKCVPWTCSLVEDSLSKELCVYNATLVYTQTVYNCYQVTFNTDEDYNKFIEDWK